MPSPFPGMDPYLERPALWRGVHNRLVTYIADDLQPQLPPHYVVAMEERVFLEAAGPGRWPDVYLVEQPLPTARLPAERNKVAVMEAGVAVAIPEWVPAPPPHEVHESYIEIYDLEGHEVVTVIEVLSPSNKTSGPGREDYLLKQQQVLQSQANLVEIDLLRQGQETVAVPAEEIARLGPADYLICTRRTARPGGFEVLRLTVRDPLPHVAIPLREGEADVVLHLAEVFTRCYDNGAYARRLDYTQEPAPPLLPDDDAWAAELLRQRGLRPA